MIQKLEVQDTKLHGVKIIHPFLATDIRGNFCKDYSKELFQSFNIEYKLEETFYTTSFRGVIRAIHFQRIKQQPKLVRCIHGLVFDVVVDLRKESPTYKQWISIYLSGDEFTSILIPAGCGHGYLVIEESIVSYKCAEKFYSEYDDGIIWNDPDLAIDWPLADVDGKIILADKDLKLKSFTEFEKNYCNFW